MRNTFTNEAKKEKNTSNQIIVVIGCLCGTLLAILLFSFIPSFDVIGIEETYAQQMQEQRTQTQWQTYKSPITKISVFIPSGWKIWEDPAGDGFEIISPDNFHIGIHRYYQGYSPMFRTFEFSIDDVGRHRADLWTRDGYTFKSSEILKPVQGLVPTDYNGNLLRYTFTKGGIVVVEYLKEKIIGTALSYFLWGSPNQIQKYWDAAKSILKSVKFDSSWELQKQIKRYEAGEITGKMWDKVIEHSKSTAKQLHEEAKARMEYCSSKLGYETNIQFCP